MKQLISTGAPLEAQSQTVYNALSNADNQVYWWGGAAGGNEAQAQHPWSAPGTFRNLYIRLETAPGVGISHIFTVRKNGADTALTVTISGTNTTGNLTGADVAVAAGDLVSLKRSTSGGTPAQTFVGWSLEFEGDNANQSGYGAAWGSQQITAAGGPLRCGPCVSSPSSSGSENLWGPAGTLTRLDAVLTTAPGAGKTLTIVVKRNTVVQDGTGGTVNTTLTISGANTVGSATFTLPVAAGDVLELEATLSAGSASAYLSTGCAFTATRSGEFQLCYHSTVGQSAGLTTYTSPSAGAWLTSETPTESGATLPATLNTYTLYGLRVKAAAAGSGQTRTWTIRKNLATPSPTSTALLSGAAQTTDFDSTSTDAVTLAVGNTWSVRQVRSASATSGGVTWVLIGVSLAVNAGPDQAITMPTFLTATMAGTITGGTAPTALWTQTAGPGTATIDDDTDLATLITFPYIAGTYTFRLTATDGSDTAFDEMDVVISTTPPPVPEDPCTIRAPRFAAALRVFNSEDGGTGIGYTGFIYGKGPFRDADDYMYGYKPPRLLDLGTIQMSASDWLTGAFPAQFITAKFADTDRFLRTQMDGAHPSASPAILYPTSWVQKPELYALMVADATRRAQSPDWRILFRGIISDDPLTEALTYSPTAKDVFGSDYRLFRAEKQIPQRTISNNDFTAYPDSSGFNGVPIIGGNVTDEEDANIGAIKLIYVGPVTYNSLTKDCWLIAGHANKQERLYQGGVEIPANDANAWWADSDNWGDFAPGLERYVSINDRWYSVAFLDGARATDAISGDAPLYANVQGMTTNALGTGALIEDYFDLCYHLYTQWVTQSYLSGPWLNPPNFPFIPKRAAGDPDPTFVDTFLRSSFTDASTTFQANTSVSPVGAFVLGAGGRRTSTAELLQQANVGGNNLLAANQYSQLMVNVLNLDRATFLSGARPVTMRRGDTLQQPGTRIERRPNWLRNHLSWQWAPNYREDGLADFGGSNGDIHTQSDHLYGRIDGTESYVLTRDAATANAVGAARLAFGAYPRDMPVWGQSLCALANPLLAGLPFSHYAGRSASGWTDRALWKTEMAIDTNACRVTCRAIDVEDLLS